MPQLTNTELAILGLLAEQPKHGYQIEQDIDMRGMREWTEIGFSSIYYVLNKLEAAGLLTSELFSAEGKTRGPARRVYRITGAGQGALHDAVLLRLKTPRPYTGDFDLALANLPALTPAEARAALQDHHAALMERIAAVQGKLAALRSGAEPLMPHVAALFEHSLALMQAEANWVQAWIADQPQNITE